MKHILQYLTDVKYTNIILMLYTHQ